MKRPILYLFLVLFGMLSIHAFGEETQVAVADSLSVSQATAGEKVNTANLKDVIRDYLVQQSDEFPHRSFWYDTRVGFHGFLMQLSDFLFPDSWQGRAYHVIEIVFQIPVLIILLLFSFAFLINVVVVSITLIFVGLYKRAREKYLERMSLKYEDLLTKYLFYDLETEVVLHELKKVRSKLGRNLLIDIFVNYQRNLSGEYRDMILKLYQLLDLNKISARRIKSFHTYKRVKGIRELANMYPAGAKSVILKYVKDKNRLVRSEAQIAYAYLDEDTSFSLLDELNQPFSTWVQLNILNYVKLHERNVPSFRKWLESTNNDVVDFSIRMMTYFQQNENADVIISQLKHPDEQTRSYVYQAIRQLGLTEGKTDAIEMYEGETFNNKIEILRVVEALGDESDFSFLIGVLKSDQVLLRMNACSALYAMGESGRAFLKEYSESEDIDLKRYIEHIKEQRN